MADVFLGQVAIGDYRSNFMELIKQRFGERLTVHCGQTYFYESLRTSVPQSVDVVWTRNYFFLRRRAVFQWNFFFKAVAAKVAVLELNPRIINVWLVLFTRWVLRRRTVLWGHAWPRAGRRSSSDRVRNVMRRMGSALLVYTEAQKRELLEAGEDFNRVIAAPNALYSARAMTTVHGARADFLYVGRLVPEKKVDLAIRAIAHLRDDGEQIPKLVVIGDGPERGALLELIEQLRVGPFVELRGHISDPVLLRECYENALAAISPGYAGLSLTQSFGFGVPVIISDREPHAPEIEAAVDGFNCLFSEADSAKSLASAMRHMRVTRSDWINRAQSISHDCRARYSTEVMAERFAKAVEGGGHE